MTTITIKNGTLKKTVFQTIEDLIESYYESKDMVVLQQINFEDLSADSQKAIEESKEKGLNDLFDFQ